MPCRSSHRRVSAELVIVGTLPVALVIVAASGRRPALRVARPTGTSSSRASAATAWRRRPHPSPPRTASAPCSPHTTSYPAEDLTRRVHRWQMAVAPGWRNTRTTEIAGTGGETRLWVEMLIVVTKSSNLRKHPRHRMTSWTSKRTAQSGAAAHNWPRNNVPQVDHPEAVPVEGPPLGCTLCVTSTRYPRTFDPLLLPRRYRDDCRRGPWRAHHALTGQSPTRPRISSE